MGLRRERECPKREVVALFTGQEVMVALYKLYPERFEQVPDQATMWFHFVDGGMAVERSV